MWLVIAIGIWTDLDIPAIWRQVVGTLRSLFLAVANRRAPSKSALSQAHTRLGPRPLRQLFVETAGPIALDQTRPVRRKTEWMAVGETNWLSASSTIDAAGHSKRPVASGPPWPIDIMT